MLQQWHAKGCYRYNAQIEYSVSLISRFQSIGSIQFLCLTHIIMGVLWGVDTQIEIVRCSETEI